MMIDTGDLNNQGVLINPDAVKWIEGIRDGGVIVYFLDGTSKQFDGLKLAQLLGPE